MVMDSSAKRKGGKTKRERERERERERVKTALV